jgi:hypothetical protein
MFGSAAATPPLTVALTALSSTVPHSADDSGGALAGAGQDQSEFLSADPPERVALAHDGPCRGAEALQHPIAGRMTEPVVDGLEVIEVEEDQRQRFAALLAVGQRRLGSVHEGAAIGHAGQHVDACRPSIFDFDALLGDHHHENRGAHGEEQLLEINRAENTGERWSRKGRQIADEERHQPGQKHGDVDCEQDQ